MPKARLETWIPDASLLLDNDRKLPKKPNKDSIRGEIAIGKWKASAILNMQFLRSTVSVPHNSFALMPIHVFFINF